MDTPKIVTFTIFAMYSDPDGYTAAEYKDTVLDSNLIDPILREYSENRVVFYCQLSSFKDVYTFLDDFQDKMVFVIERKEHLTPEYMKGYLK